ncbi:MAG: hypothetical protein JWL87_694 [Candidatus Adlerbacteria bacterium]|nr:hypothetical protein [Candidatus Adlerbacteria bacterium]
MTLALTKRIAGGAVGLMVGTLLALAAPLTYAQTTTDATTQATPGVPSTGQGGEAAATIAVLGLSAAVLVGGGLYLARTRKEA